MTQISTHARSAIRNIVPYEPGKPISEVQREYGLTDVIKLASNENPLGPSPKAIRAVKEILTDANRYPDGGCYYLKQKLSLRHGVNSSQLVIGNGSIEICDLIAEAFIGEGDEAIIGRQAFFKYRIAVQIMNGAIAWADMPELTHDPDRMLAQITARTKVMFIANPNNPTGTLMNREQVDYLMEKLPEHVIVVFDEAYYDYRDHEIYPDSLDFVSRGRNVIILRTFSKSYGLAGFRIGYAITTAILARAMNSVREAFNVNSLAQVAAGAALDDNEYLEEGIRLNRAGKRFYYTECEKLGLEYVPTEANFVLIKMPLPGRDLFRELLRKGVVIRPVDNYGLPQHVRVSIGLQSENERFFKALREVLLEKGLR